MGDATWPVTVPSEPEQGDYDEEWTPNLGTFQPDVGPPTSWRRSTLDGAKLTFSILMTDAERDAFRTFYRTTLRDGSRPFRWENPGYETEGRYLFDPASPPRIASIGAALWRVRMVFLRLGEVA